MESLLTILIKIKETFLKVQEQSRNFKRMLRSDQQLCFKGWSNSISITILTRRQVERILIHDIGLCHSSIQRTALVKL